MNEKKNAMVLLFSKTRLPLLEDIVLLMILVQPSFMKSTQMNGKRHRL